MMWGNNYVAARATPEGLLFTAGNAGRADIAAAFRAGGYPHAEGEVCENVGGNTLEFIPPEYLGLTDMPAFSEGLAWEGDDGDARAWDGDGRPIWGFPDYMIRDPWRELAQRGRVLFPIVERS
jgi:hypothetical protein